MIVFVIIGALIGAGFASGQEIYLFFYRYGIYGIFGLIVCCFLISIIIFESLNIMMNSSITNYKDFLKIIFKNKMRKIGNVEKYKYLKLYEINYIIINIFLLISYFVMIAGFGAYFEQEFGINHLVGSIILAGICFIVLLNNIKGVVKLSSIIVPFLIAFILFMGVRSWNFENIKIALFGSNISSLEIANLNTELNAIFQGILYCSYNMILVLPVFASLKGYIKNKNQICLISVLSGIIIFILSICVMIILTNISEINIEMLEMPAVYSVSQNFGQWKMIYGIIILLSIFTTAISIGVSFLENIFKNKKSYTQFAVILCITSCIISNFGFSNLVKVMFPTFGILGIIQMWHIIR